MPRNAIELSPAVHAELKRSLKEKLPGLSSSNRAEALARGLGFRTNAACLAALETCPTVVLDPRAFMAFVGKRQDVPNAMALAGAASEIYFSKLADDAPRWTLQQVGDEQDDGKPTYAPCVSIKGRGMALAVPPQGLLPVGADAERVWTILAEADHSLFDLVPHSAADAPWNRYFWREDTSKASGSPSGRIARLCYAGMGNWLWDLGLYEGGRPWPDASESRQ